ncbi:MAG: hypothetical protein WC455_22685 [Dehalococcoidia bacterium]|jgi:hypothetical protein
MIPVWFFWVAVVLAWIVGALFGYKVGEQDVTKEWLKAELETSNLRESELLGAIEKFKAQ